MCYIYLHIKCTKITKQKKTIKEIKYQINEPRRYYRLIIYVTVAITFY